jgi:hypothetical protein
MTEENRLKEGIMAEEIRVVEHYSASILNKVWEGARVHDGYCRLHRLRDSPLTISQGCNAFGTCVITRDA